MTCIVGFIGDTHVWLGGDSGAYSGSGKEIRKRPKVFRKGDMLIGAAGSLRIPQIIEYTLDPQPHPHGWSNMQYLSSLWALDVHRALVDGKAIGEDCVGGIMEDSGLLVAYRGGLYVIEEDLDVNEVVTPFTAIGSGADVAKGALHQQSLLGDTRHPSERLTDALTVAEYYLANVDSPFTIVSINKRTRRHKIGVAE
jgi:ATP-dependent protease HslVU (ClpYQ) peptidase subunit